MVPVVIERPEGIECADWEPVEPGRRTCIFFLGPHCCSREDRFECEEAGRYKLKLAKLTKTGHSSEEAPATATPRALTAAPQAAQEAPGDPSPSRGAPEPGQRPPRAAQDPPGAFALDDLTPDQAALLAALQELGAVPAGNDVPGVDPRLSPVPWRQDHDELDLVRRLSASTAVPPEAHAPVRRLLELLEEAELEVTWADDLQVFAMPKQAPRRKVARIDAASAKKGQAGFDALYDTNDGGDAYATIVESEVIEKASKKQPGPHMERPEGQLPAFLQLCDRKAFVRPEIRDYQVRVTLRNFQSNLVSKRLISHYRPQDAFRWLVFYCFMFPEMRKRQWDLYDASSYRTILCVIPEDLTAFRW